LPNKTGSLPIIAFGIKVIILLIMYITIMRRNRYEHRCITNTGIDNWFAACSLAVRHHLTKGYVFRAALRVTYAAFHWDQELVFTVITRSILSQIRSKFVSTSRKLVILATTSIFMTNEINWRETRMRMSFSAYFPIMMKHCLKQEV